MRVTNRVKDYINDVVHKKYEDYDKDIREKHDAYDKMITEYFKNAINAMSEDFKKNFPDAVKEDYCCPFSYSTYRVRNPYWDEYNKKRNEKMELIHSKCDEVLLQLDLGVKDKESLDALLANI